MSHNDCSKELTENQQSSKELTDNLQGLIGTQGLKGTDMFFLV